MADGVSMGQSFNRDMGKTSYMSNDYKPGGDGLVGFAAAKGEANKFFGSEPGKQDPLGGLEVDLGGA